MQPSPFGRYLLTERLALGGTAEIFKAKWLGVEGFEKTVVIKRILPHWSSNPHFISMLVDEAKIMVRLNHERIVQVYELGREDDSYYIAMEWIQGIDLRRLSDEARKKGAPLLPEESTFIVGEVLRGLDYIHKQKDENGRPLAIVHRDISPQNILISIEGAVKIADFGIAHAASRSYETATGVLKGKFTYMSPEQARGEAIDLRTDLFAAGIILYELLSGRRLFAGGSDLEVLEKVRRFNVDEFLRNVSLPNPLKDILTKALQANPKDRYPSAHAFWNDLNKARRTLGYSYDADTLSGRLKTILGEEIPGTKKDPPLRNFPPPEKQGTSSGAIVTNDRLHDEITRSLPHFQSSPRRKILKRAILGLMGGFLLFFFYEAYSLRIHQPAAPPSEDPPSPALETMPSIPPSFESEDVPKEAGSAVLPAKEMQVASLGGSKTGQGRLSVQAQPWGKISIAGIVNGSERPVSKNLAYGNYQVSVSYRSLSGEWKTVSRSVKVAKASTLCMASFRPDGQGSLSCR
jgi:serine/threonine protein kinase